MAYQSDPNYDQYQDIYDLKRRGAKDSVKHNDRLKEAVKKQLKNLISEEKRARDLATELGLWRWMS